MATNTNPGVLIHLFVPLLFLGLLAAAPCGGTLLFSGTLFGLPNQKDGVVVTFIYRSTCLCFSRVAHTCVCSMSLVKLFFGHRYVCDVIVHDDAMEI